MTLGEEMFFINERLRFITQLLDAKHLDQLRAGAQNMEKREAIGKEMTALKAKRYRLIAMGEKLLNQK